MLILAPLRGVTIRTFREVFERPITEAGFTEAFTPFITALPTYDPLKDRELRAVSCGAIKLTPQFIGKDPVALGTSLRRVRDAGFDTADLNCGCPYPMVRNKGRGSGLLRTPEVLERMLAIGCETMGEGMFSVKVRLGVDRPDELEKLMDVFNRYPLRFLTVHARTARQMYGGVCDWSAYRRIASMAKMPIIPNGDLPLVGEGDRMVGREFVRALGERDDIGGYLSEYIDRSCEELCGSGPVLGRIKELVAYWKLTPRWHRRWNVVKLCRTIDEIKSAVASS